MDPKERGPGKEAGTGGVDAGGDATEGTAGAAPTDAEVVRAVLGGDVEEYRVLVRRYQDRLYRHAVRMLGRPDDAADVVQETFVKGYRNLEECRHPERVGGWLFRITANLCKDWLKSRDRDRVSLEDGPALTSERGDPNRELAVSEMGRRIQEALDRLPAEQREAFVLKHLEGRSYGEMSEDLGVSESALKMRVHRAREALRELLESYR